MALYSDINGFPEAGFPVLADMEDRICLNTLYYNPLKHLGYKIDVLGNCRLLGAVIMGGALSGVTSLSIGGALSGVTTLGADNTVTLSHATAPLTISGANAVVTLSGDAAKILMTGFNASIGTPTQRVKNGCFVSMCVRDTLQVQGEPVALISDLVRKQDKLPLPGTSGNVLTSNGTDWTSAAASGGGAATSLNNLTGVAINTSLISDTDDTDDLGSTIKRWANLFVKTIGATATRIVKGWFTDLEITNLPTINGGTLASALNLSGTNTGDNATNSQYSGLAASKQDVLTFGIAQNNAVKVSAADVATGEFAKFTTTGLESRTAAEVLSDIGAQAAGTYLTDIVNDTTPQLGGDLDTNGKNIVLSENTSVRLDPAGSADGKYSGITVTGTGGATIAFGDLVTLDKDDSRWELVDISVAAAATGDARGIIGISVTSSTDGAAITVLLNGIIRADSNFPTLTIGAPVYASTTGDVVVTQPSTADYVIRVVGFGLTADEMYFNPSNDYITHT